MTGGAAIPLRPRSAIEIIDAAIDVVRGHFLALFTLAAAISLPAVALQLFAVETRGADALDYLHTLVGALLDTIATGAIIAYVGTRVSGTPLSTADALRAGLRNFGRLLVGSIAYGVLVVLGLLLFIVPGILLAARYFATPAVIVMENTEVGTALTRSSILTTGATGRVVGILGTAWVVYLVILFGITLLSQALFMTPALFSPQLFVLFTGVAQAALQPFLATLTTLLYFDLRVRREGFDLAAMLANGQANG